MLIRRVFGTISNSVLFRYGGTSAMYSVAPEPVEQVYRPMSLISGAIPVPYLQQ